MRTKNLLATVPALELDDGRILTETRAISAGLEGRFPAPSLMGRDFEERAFIGHCIHHTHPGLAVLEKPQFHDYAQSEGRKMRDVARWSLRAA